MSKLLKFQRKSRIVAAVGKAGLGPRKKPKLDDISYHLHRGLEALKPLGSMGLKVTVQLEFDGVKLGEFDLVKSLT
jgi:hypothetical protein